MIISQNSQDSSVSSSPKVNDKKNDDKLVETSLRPSTLAELVGRKREKETVRMMIGAAAKRKSTVDHILFYGPPGLGKTTFAIAIANEIGSSLHITSGPAIERQGDLAAILTNLKRNDVLFIDEIHRLSHSVEEILYPAMEDWALDIVIGKGPSAKTLRLDIEPFTLIGATTKISKISAPLRDRFGLVQRLEYFDEPELVEILARACKKLGIKYDDGALEEIAKRSRGTARVALRLLRRIRDFSDDCNGCGDITMDAVQSALKLLMIDDMGLEEIDRRFITLMHTLFDNGPVGLSTIAVSLSEDVSTISDVYEPFLIKRGLIKRTLRGRMLTDRGIVLAKELLLIK